MRVLGDSDASPELDLHDYPVEPGEVWMLCSDGINAVVPEEETEQIVRTSPSVRAAADRLVERTLELGSPDNVTAVVVQVMDSEATPPSSVSSSVTEDPSPDTAQLRVAADGDLEATQALLRYDMAARPHELVGAALLATESGQIPLVTQGTGERRAAAMLSHKAALLEAKALRAQRDAERGGGKRRYRWLMPTLLTVCIAILASVVWLGYSWTQTRYYVGVDNGKVALYQGVSQNVGPLKLSHVDTTTKVPVSVLPSYTRQNLKNGIPGASRAEALTTLSQVMVTAKTKCEVVADDDSTKQPAYCDEEVPK
jgi:protein phosphatase